MMTESHLSSPDQTSPKAIRKISIQDRSVLVGDIVVVNGYRVNRPALKQRFAEGGYQVQETPHFFLCIRDETPSIILVHWFAPEDLHTDISHYLVEELKPFGVIPDNTRLGEFMTGIVGTSFPGDTRRAWNYFGANTLQRLLRFVSTATPEVSVDYGTLGASATLYQRVCELCVGETFLDAGCNGGFLSLLLAERLPFVAEAVGADIDPQVFSTAQILAAERHVTNVRYVQADLLSHDLSTLGQFDTVTALHVMEHFTEEDMYCVLKNLLPLTKHRLILAVPYEQGKPSQAYDHLQCFSRAKLEAIGAWCLEQLEGAGRLWCEDLLGGLLLIERREHILSAS
ncbi:MAG: methyltransferase domain-containing protein [Ktedonobacteraceae bacterium]|nr:methyltransferase domain-containing protein [Ktedonobacteraceae bacterium]